MLWNTTLVRWLRVETSIIIVPDRLKVSDSLSELLSVANLNWNEHWRVKSWFSWSNSLHSWAQYLVKIRDWIYSSLLFLRKLTVRNRLRFIPLRSQRLLVEISSESWKVKFLWFTLFEFLVVFNRPLNGGFIRFQCCLSSHRRSFFDIICSCSDCVLVFRAGNKTWENFISHLQWHHIRICITWRCSTSWSNQNCLSDNFSTVLGCKLVHSNRRCIVCIACTADHSCSLHKVWSIRMLGMIWQNVKRYTSSAHYFYFKWN